jgi:hypothetical protein
MGTNTSVSVSAKDVGTVTKIKLTTASEDSWHCMAVDIGDSVNDRVHFDVDRWLQAPISTSLSVLADIPYSVVARTSNASKAESVGQFAINIYGTMGVTRTLPLMSLTGFRRGATSKFTVSAKDVGELTKVRLSTTNSDEWNCKDMVITKRGQVFPFSIDKWIVYPLAATVDTSVDVKYTFNIVTGTKTGADTTAMVFITLFGAKGQSRRLPLQTGFAKGSAETVSFMTQDVGKLTSIKLSSDSPDAWYCEGVTVKYGTSTVKFGVGRWLKKQGGIAGTITVKYDEDGVP